MEKNFRTIESESAPWLEALRCDAHDGGMKCIVNGVAFKNDKALILKRAPWKKLFPNCWDLPGGHVLPKESLVMALRREVREELGVEVSQIQLLLATWEWQRIMNGSIEHVRQFEFCIRLGQSTLQVSPEDFVESRWITEGELEVLRESRSPNDTQMSTVLRYAFEAKRAFGI